MGIYVHVPFCIRKCSYCDFYSLSKYEESDFREYLRAIKNEISRGEQWLKGRFGKIPLVSSIFFGGGTPSLLPVAMIGEILDEISSRFELSDDSEITLEANPETVTRPFVVALRQSTVVNRVSLGAQSFQSGALKKLGRMATREDIFRAVDCLALVGYDNFGLDLIFGVPGYLREAVGLDIAEAVALEPRHISFYQLTLRDENPLSGPFRRQDLCAELYEFGSERLEQLGYGRYEISNFSVPGYESRHNLLYWNGGDFLGLGPSAASRFFWDGHFHHRAQAADFECYCNRNSSAAFEFESTTDFQTVLEASFLELRKSQGVSVDEFKNRYGYDLTRSYRFADFVKENLLTHEHGCVRLTKKGMLLADYVTGELVQKGTSSS